MSSATHSNVFKQELDEAVQDAHAALDVVVENFNKFVQVKTSELEAQVPVTPVAPEVPVAPVAPVAPAAPVEPVAPSAPEVPAESETPAEDASENGEETAAPVDTTPNPAPGKGASTSQPSKQ